MTSTDIAYPEHEKLNEIKDKSQACGDFLDWLLGEKRFVLAAYHEHTDECRDPKDGKLWCRSYEGSLLPAYTNTRKLLAEFFDIDERKLEEEKVIMLHRLKFKEKESAS